MSQDNNFANTLRALLEHSKINQKKKLVPVTPGVSIDFTVDGVAYRLVDKRAITEDEIAFRAPSPTGWGPESLLDNTTAVTFIGNVCTRFPNGMREAHELNLLTCMGRLLANDTQVSSFSLRQGAIDETFSCELAGSLSHRISDWKAQTFKAFKDDGGVRVHLISEVIAKTNTLFKNVDSDIAAERKELEEDIYSHFNQMLTASHVDHNGQLRSP